MAAAALLEDELQNSLATSEEDAEFEEDDELAAELMADNADAYAANIQLQNGMAEATAEIEEDEEEDGMEDEEAMISDEDAEGEEDDEMTDPTSNNGEIDEEEEEEEDEASEDDDEDEDGEGVGAVKIQPGLLEDDEDAALGSEDDESAASIEDDDESKGSTDAEVEEQWEQAAEEEDEDEPANPNRCMYVSPPTSVSATNICPDSASKMKKMILARILNFIWLVVSVETMVSLGI
jgi:histone acetyltransferase SAS3